MGEVHLSGHIVVRVQVVSIRCGCTIVVVHVAGVGSCCIARWSMPMASHQQGQAASSLTWLSSPLRHALLCSRNQSFGACVRELCASGSTYMSASQSCASSVLGQCTSYTHHSRQGWI